MDLKDKKNRIELEKFRDKTLNNLKTHITDGMDSSKSGDYKRSALICYWLKDYVRYLDFEKNFTPKKMKKYKRGDIIKVNFGFNVGSEHGGLHYAIVIDNNNSTNSGVVTVIPMKSKDSDKKEIYYKDVDLGTGIFEKMKLKLNTVQDSISQELETTRDHLEDLYALKQTLDDSSLYDIDGPLVADYIEKVKILEQRVEQLKETEFLAKEMQKEIGRMKSGSIAIVEQITTVSKMRIFDPKTSHDVLADIRLSSAELDEIDRKIVDLFVKSEQQNN